MLAIFWLNAATNFVDPAKFTFHPEQLTATPMLKRNRMVTPGSP